MGLRAYALLAAVATAAGAQSSAPPPASMPAGERPGPPMTLQDALERAERSRTESSRRALSEVASGDPVQGFLAVDSALESDPTNAELIAAKRALEARAVEVGLVRAARMRAVGNLSQAIEILGVLSVASEDERIKAALNDAKAEQASRRSAALADRPRMTDRDGEPGVDPGERVDKRELDRRLDDVARRLEAMSREIDRLKASQFKGGAAEPQADVLTRRFDEMRRDLDRVQLEIRREVDALSREVQSLRRDVDRVRR